MRTLRRLGLAICAAFALVRDARADAAAPAEPADHGIFTSVTEQDACTPGWTSQWDQILRYCVGEDAVAMVLGERELSPGEAHKARHSKSQSGHASKAQRPDHQRVPSFPGRIENLVTDNATGLLTFYVIDERNQPGARWAAWLRSEAPPPAGSARPPPHVAPNTAPPHVQTACYARDLGLDALFSRAPVLPHLQDGRARYAFACRAPAAGGVYALRVLAEYASCAVFAPRDRNQFLGAWHAPVYVAFASRLARAEAPSCARGLDFLAPGHWRGTALAPGADGGGTIARDPPVWRGAACACAPVALTAPPRGPPAAPNFKSLHFVGDSTLGQVFHCFLAGHNESVRREHGGAGFEPVDDALQTAWCAARGVRLDGAQAAEAAERAKLWETLACNRGKVATLDRHGRTIATPNSVKELAGFTADMSDDCSTEALALVQLRKGEMTLPAAATAPLAVVSRGLHCQGKPVAVTAATTVRDADTLAAATRAAGGATLALAANAVHEYALWPATSSRPPELALSNSKAGREALAKPLIDAYSAILNGAVEAALLGPDAANGGLARVPFVSGYWHQRAWLKRPGDEGPGPNADQQCFACTSHCHKLCKFYVGPTMKGKDVRHHGTHTSLATVEKILDFVRSGVVRVAISS